MNDIPETPDCIFCEDIMRDIGSNISSVDGVPIKDRCLFYYSCINESCMVNNDFRRYRVNLDGYGNMVYQEYSMDNLYVKVFPKVTLIYRLEACFLHDEVRVPRALWLNHRNIPETLDKLRLMITFS